MVLPRVVNIRMEAVYYLVVGNVYLVTQDNKLAYLLGVRSKLAEKE